MAYMPWIICVLLIHYIILTVGISSINFESCKPLTPSQNVEMNCHPSTSTFGTESIVCSYKCKEYYTPFENSGPSVSNEVRCDIKGGNWTNLHKFRSFLCVEDCGKRFETPKPLIVHGNLTNPSTWPWHATIFRKAPDSSWHYICGGSLIRNSVILTAAHCVTRQNGELMNSDQFKIILGSISRNFSVNQQSEHAQLFEVRKIYVSTNYDSRTLQADLALIHLIGDVQFKDDVIPICLPNDYVLDLNAVNAEKLGDVVGFGVDESGMTSETLKHAQLRIVSVSECFIGLNRRPTESQFCAGDYGPDGWTTVCNGDSGGGFVVPSGVQKKYFIHGIVSSGDKDKKDGVCQNYSIFTRVFQFIFWIRDNLEQISGEVIRELAAGRNLPHVQRGTETTLIVFSGIPREYENLVTTIELVHCEIDPDVLFKTLETIKGLQSLNFTDVEFTSDLKSEHRVVLQHLKTFVLYIRHSLHGLYSFELTKSQLKSILFFDKEYQSDWPLEKITHLNVNVELTLLTSKVINVDHERGRITWQGKYCSEIIQNLPPNFVLRHLSLRQCYFNISNILEDKTLENLESLVLLDFSLTEGRWSDLLRGMRRLEELRVTVSPNWDSKASLEKKNTSGETNIYITSLPRSLRHLYLDNANVKLLQSESQIHFHENGNLDPIYSHMLPNLDIFFCYYCSIDSDVTQNFVKIFRNLKKLIIFGNHSLNITNLIQKMNQLESIIMYNGNKEKFGTLKHMPTEFPHQNMDKNQYIMKKENNRWVKSNFDTYRLTHYIHSGFENFWTSYEEYYSQQRLRTFEKSAYNSGQYQFDGGKKLERLRSVPQGVQYNLKSIQVSNAEVLPRVLLESLYYAGNLESLILDRIRLYGVFDDTKELPHLKKFRLNTIQDPDFNLRVEKENILNLLVPIARSYSLSDGRIEEVSCNVTSESDECDSNTEVRRFDYIPRPTSKQEHGSMENFEIRHDDCISISVDYKTGSFIYSMEFEDDTGLSLLNETNMKHLSLNLDEREWGLVTIPVKAEYLNLHTIGYDHPNISNVITDLLKPLDSLKEIRIVLKGTKEDTEYRPQVKLLDLKNSVKNLELFSFDAVHVEYSPSIRFDNVETVFFDSCTFGQSILENFFDIFPAVKYVAIVRREYHQTAVLSESDANERLILQALKSEKINRVLGWFRHNQNGRVVKEIRNILTGAHVHTEHSTSFFVERKNGKWVPAPFERSVLINGETTSELATEIHRLKGDLEFGPIACATFN